MLVKYGGGKEGIKAYLEEGKMSGRELTRRELDDRVILEGDLDICDQIINSRETNGEKYAHITLSFTEDEVKLNPELLKQIVADYKQFALGDGAYTEDELYFYAEAHMPRTKTEVKWNAEKKCHETVPRMIHVHIVMPTTNLITGGRAAPFQRLDKRFGEADRTQDFTDAFQEDTNSKYGLSSPHDPVHARDGFGGKADIISRIKADEFAGRKFKNHDKLKMFRNEMLDRGIESEAAFKQMLTELGYELSAKIAHGKNGDYLKVRPIGSDEKYIRLDDNQFRTDFLNKTMAQKLQAYADKTADEYQANKPAAALERARLREAWGDRARAEKYMSYGSKVHKEYLAASPDDKKLLLSKLEAKHYGRADELIGHAYFDKLISDELNFEMDAEARAEQIRFELYSNAKLNSSYLRTSDQLAAAEVLGEAIIAKPESAIAALTFSQSSFNETALQRYLLKNTANADQYDAAMRAVLANPELVVQNTDKGLLFSSREIVSIEKRLVECTERMAGSMRQSQVEIDAVLAREKKHGIVAMIVNDVLLGVRALTAATTISNLGNIFGLKPIGKLQSINGIPGIPQRKVDAIANYVDAKGRGMNEGQKAAFKLLCSDRQLGVINGAAGTGKSYILAKMNEAYKAQGFNVYGACLQGKTASDLQHDSKIDTRTIAKMLKELEKGKLVFDKKTVLVIDEAGMVGSRDLEKLMAYVEMAGGRIRLVGDAYQLAAVEYGNAFTEISKRSEVAALTEIMRQETKWMKEASEKFSRHDISGLKDYADHGKVSIEDTTKDAQISIVAKWAAHRADRPKQTCIVLAHTNVERTELNNMMRDELKRHGELQDEIDVTTKHGVMPMAVGERIMFTAPDRKMGVKNGTTGNIVGIDKDGFISVKLDNEDKIAIFNKDGRGTPEGNEITHGYCVTVHKAQGVTVDNCLALANSSMSLENLYVAMTRHRHDVEIVASAEDFAISEQLGIGRLVAHGQANYENDPNEKMSYFATIMDAAGKEHTLWGVDIKRALDESRLQIGELIQLECLGMVDVPITRDVKNKEGVVIGTEEILVHRNTWGAKPPPSGDDNASATIEVMLKKLDRAGVKAFTAEGENASWQMTERPSDSVVGQLLAEINAEKAICDAAQSAKFQEIVENLDPKRILDYVSKAYGAELDKYEIVQADNGTNLIQYEGNKYNVSSFLTKHMHLNYKDQVQPILRQCYAEQLDNVYSTSRYDAGQGINQEIRNEFTGYIQERACFLKVQKEKLDEERRTVKTEIDNSELAIEAKKQLHKTLSERIAVAKAALRVESDKLTAAIYKDFLAERALTSETHLKELWHVATTPDDRELLATIEAARAIDKAQIKDDLNKAEQETTQRSQQTADQKEQEAALQTERKAAIENVCAAGSDPMPGTIGDSHTADIVVNKPAEAHEPAIKPADLERGYYIGTVHSIEPEAVFIEIRKGDLCKLPMHEAFKQMLAGEKFQIQYKNGKPNVKIWPQKSKNLSQTH